MLPTGAKFNKSFSGSIPQGQKKNNRSVKNDERENQNRKPWVEEGETFIEGQLEDANNLPFPVEALPKRIRAFVVEGAAAMPAPTSLFAVPALVAAGAAIGNARHIRVKEGWTESPCLYSAVVCDPGTMKSPSLEKATKPVKDQASNCDLITWTSDVTVEGLCTVLKNNPRGVLLCRDELSGWVRGMNQYKEGKGSDVEFYLSAWGGQPYAFTRVSKEGNLERPFVSIVGGIPPEILPELDVSGGKTDGFLPRILYSWPEPVKVRWNENEISAATREGYVTLFDQLYAIEYDEEIGPTYLDLTEEAKAIFTAWHDAHMSEMETQSYSQFVQGVCAKLKGYCARFALIHAVCTDPPTKVVGKESVLAAIQMVEYFKKQAIKVDALFNHSASTDVNRCKSAIRRQLSVCQCLKKRDLQRKMNCNAEIFNQAIEELSTAEITIEVKDKSNYVTWNR